MVMNAEHMRYVFITVLFFCSGCAPLNTVEYTSDANGRWVKTVYSKSFYSGKIDLASGLRVTVTGYDEARVNPIASALGALGPETETPPASFVVHFLNTSTQPLNVELLSLKVAGVEHPLEPKTATIQPDEILSTGKVMGNFSVWSKDIETELVVNYNEQNIIKTIVLKQETQDEFKARMKRARDNQRNP